MKKDKLLVTSSAIALIIGFSLLAWMFKEKQSAELSTKLNQEETFLIKNHSPSLGPSDAKVTIVEFMDPECESCRAFYPFVKDIMKENEGKIRLVIRYALFHGNSKLAATILEATRFQNKYFETLEYFFQQQPNWGSHHNPRPELLWEYLPKIGIDMMKLNKDIENPIIAKNIAADIVDGQMLGIRQTPTFFINGQPLKEFGYQQLKDAINRELQK